MDPLICKYNSNKYPTYRLTAKQWKDICNKGEITYVTVYIGDGKVEEKKITEKITLSNCCLNTPTHWSDYCEAHAYPCTICGEHEETKEYKGERFCLAHLKMDNPATTKKQKLSRQVSETSGLLTDLSDIISEYVPQLYLYHLKNLERIKADAWGDDFYYDNVIVVASTSDIAKTYAPGKEVYINDGWYYKSENGLYKSCYEAAPSNWPTKLVDIDVQEIGISTNKKYIEGDIICSSLCDY